MNNTISQQDITSFKVARDAALQDIKQEGKRISKQLSNDNILFDTIKLIKDEKHVKKMVKKFNNFIDANTINEFHNKLQHHTS